MTLSMTSRASHAHKGHMLATTCNLERCGAKKLNEHEYVQHYYERDHNSLQQIFQAG